jgi:hypothetical protein
LGREVEEDTRRDGHGLRAFVPVPGRETNGWMLSHVCILPSRRNDERSRPKPKICIARAT